MVALIQTYPRRLGGLLRGREKGGADTNTGLPDPDEGRDIDSFRRKIGMRRNPLKPHDLVGAVERHMPGGAFGSFSHPLLQVFGPNRSGQGRGPALSDDVIQKPGHRT